MIDGKYGRFILPLLLIGAAVLLLLRVVSGDRSPLVSADIDIILLAALLIAGMIAAIYAIVSISMRFLRQINVRRMRQETLAEHNRFLRRLDHELKNPLTTLRAGLSALALTDLDARQVDIVVAMEKEAVRVSRLITDLRKLADLESHPLEFRTIDLHAFLGDIRQIEQERFAAGARSFSTRLDGASSAWTADEDLLALAIHNLLDNANKYTRSGDAVHLEIEVQNDLIIRVSDTGIGIAAEDIPQIYEELFRAEKIEKIPGSGIGLALVRTIVERHQGTIDIQSQPGQGTTVTMRLPPLPTL